MNTVISALSACLLALGFGCLIGWTARTHTVGDHYITALATRMAAEATYFNQKTDIMIRENERNYGNGKKKN